MNILNISVFIKLILTQIFSYRLLLALLVFILGLYFIIKKPQMVNREYFKNKEEIPDKCPNMLILKDNKFYLFNSKRKIIPGVNPIMFDSLDEYSKFIEWQNSNNIYCPVLHLQYTTNTQNEDLLVIKPDVFSTNAGTLNKTSSLSKNNMNNNQDDYDISHNKYNTNMYSGFDKYNQRIGLLTELDKKFISKDKISDNPMDPHWGGNKYTMDKIKQGKYKDRTRQLKNKID